MHVVQRTEKGYDLVVCNTGSVVNYHPSIDEDYPKQKHRCAMVIPDIEPELFLDDAVWYEESVILFLFLFLLCVVESSSPFFLFTHTLCCLFVVKLLPGFMLFFVLCLALFLRPSFALFVPVHV